MTFFDYQINQCIQAVFCVNKNNFWSWNHNFFNNCLREWIEVRKHISFFIVKYLYFFAFFNQFIKFIFPIFFSIIWVDFNRNVRNIIKMLSDFTFNHFSNIISFFYLYFWINFNRNINNQTRSSHIHCF